MNFWQWWAEQAKLAAQSAPDYGRKPDFDTQPMTHGLGAEAHPSGEVTLVLEVPIIAVLPYAEDRQLKIRIVMDPKGEPDRMAIE